MLNRVAVREIVRSDELRGEFGRPRRCRQVNAADLSN